MVLLPESLTLRGDGVVLRDWQDRDAPAIEPVCGDPGVCQFTKVPWEYTPEGTSAWIGRLRERRSAGTGLALAITTMEDDRPVGNVNLVRFSSDGREAALGYWLTPAGRGQGLATRASQTLCTWGFRELRLARIELAILPENSASHAVATRLGAVHEGLRPDFRGADGRTWDMIIYSLAVQSR